MLDYPTTWPEPLWISQLVDRGDIFYEIENLFSRRWSYSLPDYPAFSIRANYAKSSWDVENILALNMTQFIKKLRDFRMPSELCAFLHEVPHLVGNTLTPENCKLKLNNPCCWHPELNTIAILLIIWNMILKRDISEIDDYIYLALNTDTTAWKEFAKNPSNDKSIFWDSQRLFWEKGIELLNELAYWLEENFINT